VRVVSPAYWPVAPALLSSVVVPDVVSSVVDELLEASPDGAVLELDSELELSVEEDDEELLLG
jgi:hypothetical protein